MKCFICGKEIECGQQGTVVVGEKTDEEPNEGWVYEPIRGRSCHTDCLTAEIIEEIRAGKR